MSSLPPIFLDLAIILITAGVTTIIFKWLKQPLVLGYIVAGFFIGPYFPWFPAIKGTTDVHVWSDIGIVFLMFALGLEFSVKKLKKVGATGAITALTELSEEDLVRILTEPKNALVKQYIKLFAFEDAELTFQRRALEEIAHEAAEHGTGARGLRSICERILQDVMYDLPETPGHKSVTVRASDVKGETKPKIKQLSQ